MECFLNSLNSKLCKEVTARIKDDMKLSEIFMIFIEHKQPQYKELYDAIEQCLLNIDIGKFPGADIKDMCVKMRKDIKALIKENQFNSKHNAKICRILTEVGGLNNSEYANPMYAHLTNMKQEVPKHSFVKHRQT